MLDFIEVHKIVAIEGKMGAGKTTLIKSFCDALGVAETMSSPTFSLVNEYTDAEGDSIFHFDFYRMESEEEVVRIGWDEYLDASGVIVVEWPHKFPNLLPQNTVWLMLEMKGDSRVVRRMDD